MKTKDFLKKHSACKDGAKWALSISGDMVDVWETLIKEEKHDWLLWTATRPGVFSDSVLRKLACRVVRETPLADGRKVWDLLTDEPDERSRIAIEVAELYADGKATETEMAAAADAAYAAADDAARDAAYAAAYDAAYAAAFAAARDAARAAVRAAARAAAYDATKEAQVRMIAEMGNPFKEERAER